MNNKEIHYSPKLIGDLLNIIHNAILVIDPNDRIIFTNSRTAKMFKTSVKDLQGQKLSFLFMPDDVEILMANIITIVRRDGEYEGEAMFRCADGSTFLGQIAVTFFRWDTNQDGMAFTIHDITAMKSIEKSLRRSERIAFLGRLIDDISHQIRNPVSVIGGFARRLVADNVCTEKAMAILKEATHLEELLDTLRKFVELVRPSPKRIYMKELAEAAEVRLKEITDKYGCCLASEYDEDIMNKRLLVDKALILEAMASVTVNACEAYDKDVLEKPILFRVRQSGETLLPFIISITDNGVGIPADRTEHVFGHFYSNKTKHIGMGLTFARRIMEEQNGGISIDSKVGEGTTVNFHLVEERRRMLRITRIQ